LEVGEEGQVRCDEASSGGRGIPPGKMDGLCYFEIYPNEAFMESTSKHGIEGEGKVLLEKCPGLKKSKEKLSRATEQLTIARNAVPKWD
jgi:hypothetical protein